MQDDEALDVQQDDGFEQALAAVEAGQGPPSEQLNGLSNMIPEQLELFRPVWNGLSDQRKVTLIEAMHRDEEATLRLDFNEVYHLGMDDASDAVRLAAVGAIVEDTSNWLLNRLLVLVVHDPDAEVRAEAAAQLGPFALRAELGELDAQDAARLRETLLETIHRPGERVDVRAEALASVGFFSGERVRGELEDGLQDEELAVHAIRGMGHSADAAWLDTVLVQFDEPDDVMREAAATAAGEIADEAAVPALTDLIDDPALSVRLAAIAALGEIGGEEAREALVYALEDKREGIREAAVAALEVLDFFEDPLEA